MLIRPFCIALSLSAQKAPYVARDCFGAIAIAATGILGVKMLRKLARNSTPCLLGLRRARCSGILGEQNDVEVRNQPGAPGFTLPAPAPAPRSRLVEQYASLIFSQPIRCRIEASPQEFVGAGAPPALILLGFPRQQAGHRL
jgi:hypothetical protein